jgi:hypothetical protein
MLVTITPYVKGTSLQDAISNLPKPLVLVVEDLAPLAAMLRCNL